MRKLFAASVKMLYRDKQALFWAMVFPVIFTVVFGLFDFDQPTDVRVAVVADRASPIATGVVEGLEEVDAFTVARRADLAAARTELREGDQDVVVVVPPGAPSGAAAAPPTTLDVLYNQTNVEVNGTALVGLQRVVDGMNLRLAGVERPALAVRERPVEAKSVDYYDFLLPGLVAMGVMNFSIIGMSVAIARFREQRILRRILATPLRPVRFLTAQVLARVLLSLLQAGLILAVGVFLFGARIYGNVLWLFVLAAVANLVFLNIGFAVAGRAANVDAAQGIGNAVAVPMMFLSGVFFPTDTLPEIMQTVVRFLPLTPIIEAMRTVSIDGLSILETWPQLSLLGGWVLVSFALAARNFRFARV